MIVLPIKNKTEKQENVKICNTRHIQKEHSKTFSQTKQNTLQKTSVRVNSYPRKRKLMQRKQTQHHVKCNRARNGSSHDVIINYKVAPECYQLPSG